MLLAAQCSWKLPMVCSEMQWVGEQYAAACQTLHLAEGSECPWQPGQQACVHAPSRRCNSSQIPYTQVAPTGNLTRLADRRPMPTAFSDTKALFDEEGAAYYWL